MVHQSSPISLFPNGPPEVDYNAIKISSLIFVKLDPIFMPKLMEGTCHVDRVEIRKNKTTV